MGEERSIRRHGEDRAKWLTGIIGLLLLVDLLKLPWHSGSSETISGIVISHPSTPATGSPAGWLGLLAVLATLAAVLDLVAERLSPATEVPAIGGSRSTTRYVLAVAATVLIALKFIFHLDQIGDLGVGFWLGAVLAGALVACTAQAREARIHMTAP